jgi:hypothetical protein
MESAFGWTQIARSDVAKATELLKGEDGVRDEIGFLTLHQGFADRFFPGTSVLQTRLRYALFVPWQIEDLEQHSRSGALTAEQRLRTSERKLVRRLKNAGDGVIGLRSVNYDPAQPPSTIYWTALRLWGILSPSAPSVWPGRAEVLGRIDASKWSEDRAEGGTPLRGSTFFALPERPAAWSEDAALTFRLSSRERRYLLERIQEAKRIAPAGKGEESLLSRLAKSKKQPASWSDAGYESPLLRELADVEDREALEQAIAAASLAHVGRAVYSALVESMAKADGRETRDRYAQDLDRVVARQKKSALLCDLHAVQAFIGPLEKRFLAALESTLLWLEASDTDVMALWKPYCESEEWRKTRRARLRRTAHAESLRMAWLASDAPKAQPLNYRWHRVGVMLNDLHDLYG